ELDGVPEHPLREVLLSKELADEERGGEQPVHDGRFPLKKQRITESDRDRPQDDDQGDRKSTRLNSSHVKISYAVFCLKEKNRRRKGHCSRHRFAPAVHAGAAAPGDWPRRLRSASRPCCPLPYRGVQE